MELLAGLYAVGIQVAAVLALVFVVAALMGRAAPTPLTHPHDHATGRPRAHRK